MTTAKRKTIDISTLGPGFGVSRNGQLMHMSQWEKVKPQPAPETPYIAPMLNDTIVREFEDPVAASFAKLGIPYMGDPAADNAQRLAANKDLFATDEDLVLNGGEVPYVAPNLTANIARDFARRAQQAAATGDYAGAGGGACGAGGCSAETPYIAPTLF